MTDPTLLLTVSAGTLGGLGLLSLAGLRAWTGWLDLKRLQLTSRQEPDAPTSTTREVADLKQRLRRLEAIANGAEQ
jgi:hypothetical protein